MSVWREDGGYSIIRDALDGISGMEFMPEAPYGKSNHWLTIILITPEELCADRETVQQALETENIVRHDQSEFAK